MQGTCAGCKEGFKAGDQVLSALDQKWHPQHFTCSSCKQQITGGFATDSDGKAYCPAHVPKAEQRICGGCGKPITAVAAYCLRKHWHPECVICAVCNKQISNARPREKNGKPVCPTCAVGAVQSVVNARVRGEDWPARCERCRLQSSFTSGFWGVPLQTERRLCSLSGAAAYIRQPSCSSSLVAASA